MAGGSLSLSTELLNRSPHYGPNASNAGTLWKGQFGEIAGQYVAVGPGNGVRLPHPSPPVVSLFKSFQIRRNHDGNIRIIKRYERAGGHSECVMDAPLYAWLLTI